MDKIQQRSLSYSKSAELLQKIKAEPQYCECAYIGSRALADGNMPVLRYLTNLTDYFDKNNLQLEHQHIIFRQSKDNIGLMGNDGAAELFQEDPASKTYHIKSSVCLDGSIMRKAIEATGIPKAYAWLGYNCQAYAQEVSSRYMELKEDFNSMLCLATKSQ